MAYKSKTDDELRQLARDMYEGRIFTDRHVANIQDIKMVFLPLALMDTDQWETLIADDIELIYEELSKFGPLSCNGMPWFMSFQVLNKADFDKVKGYFNQYKNLQEKFSGVVV